MNKQDKQLLINLIKRRLKEIEFSVGMKNSYYKDINDKYNKLIEDIKGLSERD